ncbi:MAG: hypothetical protein Q4D20_02190 [Clostridia bacterium]|nr:hypothetical protein [Clostridia bacterium]
MAIEITKSSIKIENSFISKELFLKSNGIASSAFLNKITGESFVPAQGSEEFKIRFLSLFGGDFVSASDLRIQKAYGEKTETGERLKIEFKAFKMKGGKISLTLVYELGMLDKFIRKYLVFSCLDKDCKAVIDYVDFEPLVVPDVSKASFLPKQGKSHMNAFALSLGQPVFYGSFCFGNEFPGTENNFENGATFVRWYSGKPLVSILKKGEYTTYKAVCVACTGSDEVRRKTSFYEYIHKIARPLRFRTQYNSWYDHMLKISAENIEGSFLEVEKELTSVGSKPLDCFVVDDGWNDYSKDFWCFNEKFPNELYPSAALARSFGSSFGLWLGPRGGYTLDTVKFARHIENGGNGFVNRRARDICVASEKYIEKLSSLMIDYETRFGLSYWKLDGFANRPCRNKNHDHMVGGKNDMYYYSELWERWIAVFSALVKNAKEDLFINLTCYAPPSPWFLQWVNTVWMQNSADIGFINKSPEGKKLSAPQKDQALTYRDNMYYDFYRERGFCFPPSNMYNHDPIYGNEAKISMTDDQFREYLFTNAMRGTEFWELYYSFNMMNENKWRISEATVSFARENLSLLSRSVLFGGKPSLLQVYGFGCFDGNEGIVMLRNPGTASSEYTLRLDHTCGADEKLSSVSMTTILPYSSDGESGSYSFGDTLRLTLSPFETRILHFGKRKTPLSVVYCKARSEKTLEVFFNQTVVENEIACEENKIVSAELLADYRSVLLTFENPFEERNGYTLSGVSDVLKNKADLRVSFTFFKDGAMNGKPISGNADFSIKVTLDDETDKVLYAQGEELKVSVENGFVYFKVGNKCLVSSRNIHDVVQICAVRERNGVLKLYFNQKPDSALDPDGFFELKGENQSFSNEGKIKLFDNALSFDRV